MTDPTLPPDIGDVTGAYAAAVFDHDVDALMRLYDPAVRVFDAWGTWLYDGAPAWRAMVEGWLGSLGDERVTVTFDDVRVVEGDAALALLTAVVSYAGTAQAMQNRLTWALRRDGSGGWRIVHEHTSVPVGTEDGKAMLQRQP